MSAPMSVIILTWAVLSVAPAGHQAATTGAQQQTLTGVVSLIGCVERVPAVQGAPTTATAATFKLIDVQPGAGTRMPVKADAQFLLSAAKSLTQPIEIGKFQNQRVEVTGTVVPAPPAVASPQAKPGAAAPAPLPTLTFTSLKAVSTECK